MIKKEKFKFNGLKAISTCDNMRIDSMSSAYNVRVAENGNIKSVCKNNLSETIIDNNGFDIKYCHSFASFNNYFAIKHGDIHWVELINGEIVSKRVFIMVSDENNPDLKFEFFGYGDTIYLTVKRAGAISVENIYQWIENNYVLNRLMDIDPPCHSKVECSYKYSSISGIGIPSMIMSANMNNNGVEEYFYPYRTILDGFINANFIYGTIYLIYAYKLKDGTIIKQSGINMIESNRIMNDYDRSIYIDKASISKRYFYKRLVATKPKLTFSIPQIIINDKLIESIVIYSTRNNSFYDFDNINEKLDFSDELQEDVSINGKTYTKISARSIIDTPFVEVARTPFYKIAEFDFRVEDFIELNFMEHYNNIEMKPIFVPNMSSHNMVGINKYIYNSRIHLLGVKTTFFDGEIITPSEDSVEANGLRFNVSNFNQGRLIYITTLEDNGETFFCKQSKTIPTYYIQNSSFQYVLLPNMITYPDIRAKKIEVYFIKENGEEFSIDLFELTKAPENGCAYYQNTYLDSVATHFMYQLVNSNHRDLSVSKNITIYKNKIIISQINNPSVFNYENAINVNNHSTIVRGVETIYHDFADIAFGLYPLYVFTNNGIFALESKDPKSVYSNIIPINSQITDSDFSSISVGGQVFFLSNRGLCSIHSTVVTYLSQDMEQYLCNGVLFTDYIKGATINHGSYYNELIINNPNYNYCYLYGIGNKQFTTREFDYQFISYDKAVGKDGIYWLTRAEDSSHPQHSYIESIGGGFESNERKKIRSCKLIGMFKSDANFSFYGSNDLKQWNKIKSIDANEKSFKKAMGSWRYLKFSVSANYMELDSMELELEVRKL